MLLTHARRHARATADGDLITLEEQDRALWDQGRDYRGPGATRPRAAGPATRPLPDSGRDQRAARPAPSAAETDWRQIALLYEALAALAPSPVVALNHAAAVAMADGPQRGLTLLDDLALAGDLRDYHHYHAARADLLRRAGRRAEAAAAYQRALILCQNQVERRYLERRLEELGCRPSWLRHNAINARRAHASPEAWLAASSAAASRSSARRAAPPTSARTRWASLRAGPPHHRARDQAREPILYPAQTAQPRARLRQRDLHMPATALRGPPGERRQRAERHKIA